LPFHRSLFLFFEFMPNSKKFTTFYPFFVYNGNDLAIVKIQSESG